MDYARLYSNQKVESNFIENINGYSLFCSMHSTHDGEIIVCDTSVPETFFPAVPSLEIHPFSSDVLFLSASEIDRIGYSIGIDVTYWASEDPCFDSSKFLYSLIPFNLYDLTFRPPRELLKNPLSRVYLTDNEAHRGRISGVNFRNEVDFFYPASGLAFDSYDEALNYAMSDYYSRFYPHSLDLYGSTQVEQTDYMIFIYRLKKYLEKPMPVDYYETVFRDTVFYDSDFFRIVAPVTPFCCYPDFSPILRILGGTPSLVQLENLKSICYLLGVNTVENGLKDCDLMKEYLKRLNQILGGSRYPEPNDNLKSICYLLGVDNSENGLKDCELSKDYVKRISKMLGAE